MTGRCPSELALEQHLLAPAASKIAAHVAGCARCEARLSVMAKQGEEFNRFVFPATVDAVVEPKRAAWLRWLLFAAPVAAAAGVLLVVLRPVAEPPPGYTGSKGAELSLALFSAGPDGARSLTSGAAVHPEATLRFRVRAARPCNLWILSLDDAGQVSRIYPRDGAAGGPFVGAAELPGGAVLDGHAGAERFFAVCSEQLLPFAEVERAAAQAPRGAAGVRATSALPGLPAGVMQASVLVEKREHP
jgi:hypothetical protein